MYTGSIHIYRSEDLSPEVNTTENIMEVVYLQLNTSSNWGVFQAINEASTPYTTSRLEVELARTSREFYRVAEDLEHDEAALDLILLLQKGSDLSAT